MSLPSSVGGKKARAGGSPSGAAGRCAVAIARLVGAVAELVWWCVRILVLLLVVTVRKPRQVGLVIRLTWRACRGVNRYGLNGDDAVRWAKWREGLPREHHV